jgi:radical SAM protein
MRRRNDARLASANFDLCPFTLAWEITRACALACLHCRAEAQPRRDTRELSTAEALALIDQIRAMGNPILVVTGGDPLMRRDVYELLAYATHKGLRTSLTPTATALANPRNLERVRQAGVLRVAISLDGPTAQVHDRLRGFSGSFRRTLQIMRDVREAGLALQVNTTVSRHNLAVLHRMPEIVAESGAVQWSLFFLVPTGRARLEDMISAQEHEETFHWLYDLSRQAPFDVKSTAAPAYRRVAIQRAMAAGGEKGPLAGAGYRFEDGLDRPALGVNDGKGFAFISHTGEVCPSGFLPLSAGNVRERPLAEIYRHSPLFRDLRDPGKLKGKCHICRFRSLCGGSRARAWAVTGDYLAEDPSCVYMPGADVVGAWSGPVANNWGRDSC